MAAILDYETLKSFMHPALMDSFPEEEPPEDAPEDFDGGNATLKAAVKIANASYTALTSSMPTDVVVRFDSLTYTLKQAFCHIYEFILHDVGYLTHITLTGLGLAENQVWEHFKALLDMEREELEKMKKDLLDEIKDKEDKANYAGVLLYHRYGSSGGR